MARTPRTDQEKKISRYMGEQIRALRKKSGLTQQRLAEKVNRDHAVVSRIEGGSQTMSLDLFVKFCVALGAEYQDVLPKVVVRKVEVEVAEFDL